MDGIVQGRDGFARLAPHWEKLAAAGGVETPFQSFAWLDLWLQHRGVGLEPFILVLHGGETIAPLGRARRAGIRVLQLLGSRDSDYPGLVTIRPSDEAWDAVACTLSQHRGTFDLLHLDSMRNCESIVPALERHLGSGGRKRLYEVCPWIPTNCTWPEFLASLGTGLRNNIKRWNRLMRALGEVTIEPACPPLGDSILSELADVERTSWKWESGNAAFRPGSQRDFLEAVLCDSRSNLVVWLLRIDRRLVAYAIVLAGRARWYHYLTSFRKDSAHAGSFLLSRIAEAACTQSCEALDLLRGDHGYKRAWTNLTTPVFEIAWPSNVRGRTVALGLAVRWRAARSERLARLRARLLRVGDRR
jgi:CelD/BcsL family acetyltransferase involved in cellulose biosynthesis